MKTKLKWVRMLIGASLMLTGCAYRAAGEENVGQPAKTEGALAAACQFPRAVVPYVGDRPPTIDGMLNKDEYQRFAAITGMVAWGGPSGFLKTIVPKIQQVVWYLGYDDKYFYIAMHSPNPPGIWPLARGKKNDGGGTILYDDHVEIQIAKDRARATFGGVGFYKIIANAKGFRDDDWYYNGTPGTEGAWSIGGEVKCSVTAERWDMEIAIDIRAFNEKKLNGKTWVLQLLRADAPGGVYFAGWVGDTWLAWPNFGEVTFDAKTPVFRFLETGELAKGEMNFGFEVVGREERVVPVQVKVRITDSTGKSVYDESQSASVSNDQVKSLAFEKNVPLTDKGNRIEILATYPREDTEGNTVQAVAYHFQAPIIKLTDEFWQTHIAPWLKQRPQGDLDWQFAYWPSYGVAKTALDVDFFGVKKELETAVAFIVSVAKKGGDKPLVTQRAELKDRVGNMILKGLDLTDGAHTAKVEVIGADGRTVVGLRTMDFVRKKYAWDGNQLGVSNQVIPPYTPIQADAAQKELKVWGRTYTLGDDGLLRKINAGGGPGPEEILRAPMTWSATVEGVSAHVSGAGLAVHRNEPGRVEFVSEGRLGGLSCHLASCLEYDGWYHVMVTLDPSGKDVSLDALTLNIPLWKGADTIYVQRAGDGRRGNLFGNIPADNGRVWDSSKLLPYLTQDYNWQSFVPVVYLGNGDKGLWWFADENRDWSMSDRKAAVEIFRVTDGIDLKVNFIAAPVKVAKPRRLEFAFLVDPVKRMPDERKWAWGRLAYSHNTYGYRFYGGSVDGYENTDEDLEALNRVFTDPNWKPDPKKTSAKDPSNLTHINHFRNTHFDAVANQKQKLVLYGSTWMTGLGMEEFDTFGGEWLGRTNWKPSPQTEFTGCWNLQQSKEWKTERDTSSVGMNFIRSQEDCFIWHHQRLLSKTPVNGTWWDNASIGLLEDYDPQTGEFYQRFNIFARRSLTKRLNQIGHEIGREPWWINNMHVDWSWCQIAWHVENDYYTQNADAVMQEQLPVEHFRALCRLKRGIIHRLYSIGPEGTTEQVRRLGRSLVGMCLLHDIGSYCAGADRYFAKATLDLLDDKVGFFDGAEYIGYWRSGELVRHRTPGVYISVYRGKNRAMLVALNERREDVDVAFDLGPNLLNGRPVARICDAETGFEFKPQWDAIQKRSVLGELKPGYFGLPDRGVRYIVVE
ncbi:MAG: hypothetical protein HY360_22955 [Verrucomicrobia bacterium]|nr:hypothetical protein [Verrucomicrobiota bacterium]